MHPIFILVGPSGSGKTTAMERLLAIPELGLQRVVTTTTREPREGEQNGREYWFLNKDEFKRGIEADTFTEWIQGFDHYYGTSRAELERQLEAGPVITVTDMPGALEIRKQFPNTKIVFLSVPREQLIGRLKARNSKPETFEMRVAKIDKELETARFADIMVDNQDGKLEQAVREIENFVRATMRGI